MLCEHSLSLLPSLFFFFWSSRNAFPGRSVAWRHKNGCEGDCLGCRCYYHGYCFIFCPFLAEWKEVANSTRLCHRLPLDVLSHSVWENCFKRSPLIPGFFIRGSLYMHLGVLTKPKGTLANSALNYVLQRSRSENYFKTYYFPFISNLTMPYHHWHLMTLGSFKIIKYDFYSGVYFPLRYLIFFKTALRFPKYSYCE